MVDLISLLDSMKEINYIFFNVFGLLLTISSIITLFVTSRGYPESTFAVQLEYFSIVIFVISVLAIPFLIKISNVKFSLQDLFWTVFIFLIFVNFILFGGINEHRYTIFLLLSLLYICFRVICLHNKIGKNIIILCLLVCGISQSILGFLQLFDIYPSYLSRFKVTGSFFNPGPFSALIAMSLVLAVSLLLKYDYKSNKYLKSLSFWITAICALFCSLLIPVTMSRSAWISIFAVLLIVFLRETKFIQSLKEYLAQNLLKYTLLVTLTIIIISSLGLGMYLFKKDSADGRILIWKNSISLIKENPLLGVGIGLFGGAYGDKQAEYFEKGKNSQIDVKVAGVPQYAFNDYLQLASEAGIPALLFFLFFISFAIKDLYKTKSELLYPFFALLTFSLTSYPINVLPLSIIFIILSSSVNCSCIIVNNKKLNRIVFFILLAIGIYVSGNQLFNKRGIYSAFNEWKDIQRLYNTQHFNDICDNYASLFDNLNNQERFLFEYGRVLNQTKNYQESNKVLYMGTKISSDPMFYNVIGNNYKLMGLNREAENAYMRAYYVVPNRLYPLYLITKLYYETNQIDKFINYAELVLNFNPKVNSNAIIDMKEEIRGLLNTLSQTK